MEQQQELAPTAPAVSSFMTRAANVFSAPGELYKEVADAPVQTSSWAVPYVVSLIIAVLVTFSLFYNNTLRQQVYDMQQEGMKKAVAEGKMTQEQMDRAVQGMESSGPVLFMVIGGGLAIITLSIMFFGGALAVWLVAKFVMKFEGNYNKMMEVYGLATLVGILGAVIYILMINLFDTMHATPGLGLMIMNSFDPENVSHRLMAGINVFTLWQTAVLGIGLACVSRKTIGFGLGISFGLWVLWLIISAALNFGVR